jgi:hypothetical protein
MHWSDLVQGILTTTLLLACAPAPYTDTLEDDPPADPSSPVVMSAGDEASINAATGSPSRPTTPTPTPAPPPPKAPPPLPDAGTPPNVPAPAPTASKVCVFEDRQLQGRGACWLVPAAAGCVGHSITSADACGPAGCVRDNTVSSGSVESPSFRTSVKIFQHGEGAGDSVSVPAHPTEPNIAFEVPPEMDNKATSILICNEGPR